MNTREWMNPTLDRSAWPAGEWDSEPDKMQWPDPATGLPCMMKRNRSGAWCGYVGVAKGHPWFDDGYQDVDADVHGGLTYADFCEDVEGELGICHVPGPGEPDNVYWLGFDCHHYRDVAPGSGYPPDADAWYKDVAYVKAECTSLAAQIAAVAP